jgi:outer membrane protein OmpA-like peptidoglycan-associated protein
VPTAENPAYHTAAASVAPAPKPQPEPAAASPRMPDAAPTAIGFHINFAFDSAALPSAADGMIDRIAELMKEAPQIRLRVEGHTDATGSADYNEALSERRALSVAEYLVRHGIEPGRLIVIGKGMKEPLGEDRFAPGNRRVQFVRIG